MDKEEREELEQLMCAKTIIALTGITTTSEPESDKYAAEAVLALTRAMMCIGDDYLWEKTNDKG